MKITEELFPIIEKALDIKLYDAQKEYLLGKIGYFTGRQTGRTTAICIGLALSNGRPLRLSKPWEFSDYPPRMTEDQHKRYSIEHFRNQFLEIREKLRSQGLPVREIRRW